MWVRNNFFKHLVCIGKIFFWKRSSQMVTSGTWETHIQPWRIGWKCSIHWQRYQLTTTTIPSTRDERYMTNESDKILDPIGTKIVGEQAMCSVSKAKHFLITGNFRWCLLASWASKARANTHWMEMGGEKTLWKRPREHQRSMSAGI